MVYWMMNTDNVKWCDTLESINTRVHTKPTKILSVTTFSDAWASSIVKVYA